MSRIDKLVSSQSEEQSVLAIKVPKRLADNLKAVSKRLGLPRSKMVYELFMSALEEFEEKYGNR